jgi:hypothetical protein
MIQIKFNPIQYGLDTEMHPDAPKFEIVLFEIEALGFGDTVIAAVDMCAKSALMLTQDFFENYDNCIKIEQLKEQEIFFEVLKGRSLREVKRITGLEDIERREKDGR